MNGLEFLQKMKLEQPGLRFLMITAHGTMDMAIQALRYGASDFLTKPFENPELRQVVERLLREAARPAPSLPTESAAATPEGVVGRSGAFQTCLDMARKAAQSDSTVLMLGESGTGKEVMARTVHDLSARREKPFIPVNCGAIPENLIESELFGHEKGAFTGAMSRKTGKFVLAEGGTVFLDEIGELPLSMQVKLLRVLQERSVDPVGGEAGSDRGAYRCHTDTA
jgi:DNA-binding NtrC family response regulator